MSDIRVYYGEFMFQFYPLELSGNFCSHACAYCYANLNKPDRTADPQATLNLIKTADEKKHKNLAAYLISERYPILASNHIDPFSNSNWQLYQTYFDLMRQMNIPFGIQTRGAGKQQGAKKLLHDIITDGTPKAFFISITSDKPHILKTLESGAPSYTERIDLIETLKAYNHPVIAAFAPFIPSWWNNPNQTIDTLHKLNIKDIFISPVHFSTKQIANMTNKARTHFEPIISTAKTNDETRKAEELKAVETLANYAKSLGMRVNTNHKHFYENIWDVFYPCYPKRFPTLFDFIDWCSHNKNNNDIISWKDYKQFFSSKLPNIPKNTYQLDSYIAAASRHLWATYKIPTKMTYNQLLQILWKEPNIKTSLIQFPCFIPVIQKNTFLTDENGLMVYRFSKPSS